MLSDKRIRELALIAVKAQNWSPNVDQAIRLAVAEAVEECKAELAAANAENAKLRAEVERLREDAARLTDLCGMVSQSFTSGEWYITESLRGETFRDAIDAARKE